MSKDQKQEEAKKNLEFMRLAIEEAKKSEQEKGKTPLYVLKRQQTIFWYSGSFRSFLYPFLE